jgi:hypothetical protein
MSNDTDPSEGPNVIAWDVSTDRDEADGRPRGILTELSEMQVPAEERPHRESLAAISTPARSVSMRELIELGPDEQRETPLAKIEATPEELRAHMKFHIERAIERKIEQGELERVNEGEK